MEYFVTLVYIPQPYEAWKISSPSGPTTKISAFFFLYSRMESEQYYRCSITLAYIRFLFID